MKWPILKGFDPQSFKKYLFNTGWLLGARVGSLLIKMLVTTIALPNYLGATDHGILNYPLVFISFFVALAALGMDSYVTRQLLAHPLQSSALLGTAFRCRMVAGILVIPLIYGSYILYSTLSNEPPTAPLSYILIVSLVCVFQSIHLLDSYFQAQTQGKWIMMIQVGANLTSALIKGILIWIGAPLIAFVYSLVLDALLLSVGYLYGYWKVGGRIRQWTYDATLAKSLLRHSLPLAFSAFLVILYMRIGQMMIDHYLGPTVFGVYATVMSLTETWYFVPSAIVTALFPAIMHAKASDPAKFHLRMQQLYQLMVVISVTAGLIIHFAAPWIYQAFYTPAFHSGGPVLSVQVWAGVFIFLNLANGQYLLAEGYTSILFIRALVGAFIMIALNILWIPLFGMMGAAYATVVGYACSAFFVLFIPKTRKHGWMMLKALTFVPLFKKLRI
jgi:O-antigen/teichoic acid export membrane protein